MGWYLPPFQCTPPKGVHCGPAGIAWGLNDLISLRALSGLVARAPLSMPRGVQTTGRTADVRSVLAPTVRSAGPRRFTRQLRIIPPPPPPNIRTSDLLPVISSRRSRGSNHPAWKKLPQFN